MKAEEIIDSYINGQFKQARNQLGESELSLGELLESYIEMCNPNSGEIVFFVKVMEKR